MPKIAAEVTGHNQKIQNVIFLVVDALRFCYLRKGGNSLNLCPTINSLSENGIVCTNVRSNSCPTQLSYPSIFTSTLPLDHGGYDNGIIDRPLTIAQALSEAGLQTFGISTAQWPGCFYGYDRGFDEFIELSDINKFWEIFAGIYYTFYTKLFNNGIISSSEYYEIVAKLFESVLKELLRQCNQAESQLSELGFKYDKSLHRHDFALYIVALEKVQAEFLKDPVEYLENELPLKINANIKIFLTGIPEKEDSKDITTYPSRTAIKFLRHFGMRFKKYSQSISSGYVRKLVNDQISKNANTPSFIWAHFMDLHDRACTNGQMGFAPNFISLGLQRHFDADNTILKKDLYSLRYVDKEIARIVAKLQSDNLLESTLIVICGDHGAGTQAFESDAGNLFDESNHVPAVFYNPGIQSRVISEPCSLIDIAPTILSLMNLSPRSEFDGVSLTQNLQSNRPVILESLGAGPGDFRFKAIKIAVLQADYKLIWREPGYEDSCPAGKNYLFNLAEDPTERNNLYDNSAYRSVACELEKIAMERCKIIREKAAL